jgi:hypothetical protein
LIFLILKTTKLTVVRPLGHLGRPRILRFLVIALLVLASFRDAQAQDLSRQPTAFTAYIDFSKPTPSELPIWIEGIETESTDPTDTAPKTTIYRIRFRHFSGLVDELLLRTYFDDSATAHPSISGWSEIGNRVLGPVTLGQGLNLPSSQTVRIPMAGIDYVEIQVPGDGSTVRGLLAVALHQAITREAIDFGGAAEVTDPFGNATPATTGSDDSLLFGRVKATLEPGVIQLGTSGEDSDAEFEVPLQQAPLVALLTFEVLNADITAPPHLFVNGQDAGAVSVTVTDLADPALTGAYEPVRQDSVYRYAGWLKCQKVIPGSLLVAGTNSLDISTPGHPAPVAIRSVEVQLKYTQDATAQ